VDFLLSFPSTVTDFLLSLPSSVTDFLLSFGSTKDTCLIIKFWLIGLLFKTIAPQQPQISTNPKMTEKPMAAPTPLLIDVSVVLT